MSDDHPAPPAPQADIDFQYPKISLGYVYGAAAVTSFFVLMFLKPDPKSPYTLATGTIYGLMLVSMLTGIVYWFLSVHKLHRTLEKATGGSYPISAGKAVGYQFIPFFNIYWMFKWPAEVAEFVNHVNGQKFMGKYRYGGMFLLSSVLARLITGISLLVDFWVLGYLSTQVREAVQDRSLPVPDYSREKYKTPLPAIIVSIFAVV